MNDSPLLLKRTQERRFSAHNTLIRIARVELELAKPGNVGEFDHAFTAITFSALAIEALANAVGDRVIPDWKDFESSSPYAKARLLAERLGAPYEHDKEPWQTIRWLSRFRNQVAHPKPELVKSEEIVPAAEADDLGFNPPKSKLELQVSEQNAKRAVEAVEQLKYSLTDRIKIDDRFGLPSDGWLTSTSAHE